MAVIQSSELASAHAGAIAGKASAVAGSGKAPYAITQNNRPAQGMWEANSDFAAFLRELGEQMGRDAAYIAAMQRNFDGSDEIAAGSFK